VVAKRQTDRQTDRQRDREREGKEGKEGKGRKLGGQLRSMLCYSHIPTKGR